MDRVLGDCSALAGHWLEGAGGRLVLVRVASPISRSFRRKMDSLTSLFFVLWRFFPLGLPSGLVPTPPPALMPTDKPRKLFVGNLPADITQDPLRIETHQSPSGTNSENSRTALRPIIRAARQQFLNESCCERTGHVDACMHGSTEEGRWQREMWHLCQTPSLALELCEVRAPRLLTFWSLDSSTSRRFQHSFGLGDQAGRRGVASVDFCFVCQDCVLCGKIGPAGRLVQRYLTAGEEPLDSCWCFCGVSCNLVRALVIGAIRLVCLRVVNVG